MLLADFLFVVWFGFFFETTFDYNLSDIEAFHTGTLKINFIYYLKWYLLVKL